MKDLALEIGNLSYITPSPRLTKDRDSYFLYLERISDLRMDYDILVIILTR